MATLLIAGLHYVHLPPEAPDEIPENKPHEEWPSEGSVEFRYVDPLMLKIHGGLNSYSDYSLKYRPELEPSLKNISLKIVSAVL